MTAEITKVALSLRISDHDPRGGKPEVKKTYITFDVPVREVELALAQMKSFDYESFALDNGDSDDQLATIVLVVPKERK
jgi:hypothetical protein